MCEVDGETKKCSDPPLDFSGYCNNACYSANVTSDGSYNIECLPFDSKVKSGECAPLKI